MKVEVEIPDNCEIIREDNIFKIVEKKEEVNLPMSWEEFCKKYPRTTDEHFIDDNSRIKRVCNTRYPRDTERDKNICTSKEEAEAFLALMQLRQLRKAWVGDWAPNEKGFTIIAYRYKSDTIVIQTASWTYNYVLSFPTETMAKDFLNCFKDLCETAKMLL